MDRPIKPKGKMRRPIGLHSASLMFFVLVVTQGCGQNEDDKVPKRHLLANAPHVLPQKEPPPEPEPVQPPPPPQPQYDAARLKRAAEIKPWSQVHVDGTSVDCWMKTRWQNGMLTMRLALLGGREDLETWHNGISEYKVKFADAMGNIIMEYTIASSDFAWAPPTVNNGVPTLQFESSIDCPLETYEQSRSWQFFWNH